MDSTVLGMTLAGAVFAFALISNSRAHAMRQREADFFARHLRVGRRIDGGFRLLPEPW
jgi:hypothetical protein